MYRGHSSNPTSSAVRCADDTQATDSEAQGSLPFAGMCLFAALAAGKALKQAPLPVFRAGELYNK